MTEFDPHTHRMVKEQRWFEDFALGERFVLPGRTQTSAIFAAFQTASGDTHPVHYDVEPVPETGLCRRYDLPRARSYRARAGTHHRRRHVALDRVQPAQGAGAGGNAEIPDPPPAGLDALLGLTSTASKHPEIKPFGAICRISGCRHASPALTTVHEIPR
jgi:hypothetical protein